MQLPLHMAINWTNSARWCLRLLVFSMNFLWTALGCEGNVLYLKKMGLAPTKKISKKQKCLSFVVSLGAARLNRKADHQAFWFWFGYVTFAALLHLSLNRVKWCLQALFRTFLNFLNAWDVWPRGDRLPGRMPPHGGIKWRVMFKILSQVQSLCKSAPIPFAPCYWTIKTSFQVSPISPMSPSKFSLQVGLLPLLQV